MFGKGEMLFFLLKSAPSVPINDGAQFEFPKVPQLSIWVVPWNNPKWSLPFTVKLTEPEPLLWAANEPSPPVIVLHTEDPPIPRATT